MEHPGEYGNMVEEEESDEDDNSTTRNGRGILKEFKYKFLRKYLF
jgi:hypothetical protein